MCYEIKPDALIKTLQRIVYPFIIQYDLKRTEYAYRYLLKERQSLLLVYLKGRDINTRIGQLVKACVTFKKLIKFPNLPVKSLGKHGH